MKKNFELKRIGFTREFEQGAKQIFFISFYPDYIKTVMLAFTNRKSKMLNFKTFKIVLLAT